MPHSQPSRHVKQLSLLPSFLVAIITIIVTINTSVANVSFFDDGHQDFLQAHHETNNTLQRLVAAKDTIERIQLLWLQDAEYNRPSSDFGDQYQSMFHNVHLILQASFPSVWQTAFATFSDYGQRFNPPNSADCFHHYFDLDVREIWFTQSVQEFSLTSVDSLDGDKRSSLTAMMLAITAMQFSWSGREAHLRVIAIVTNSPALEFTDLPSHPQWGASPNSCKNAPPPWSTILELLEGYDFYLVALCGSNGFEAWSQYKQVLGNRLEVILMEEDDMEREASLLLAQGIVAVLKSATEDEKSSSSTTETPPSTDDANVESETFYQTSTTPNYEGVPMIIVAGAAAGGAFLVVAIGVAIAAKFNAPL